MQETKTSFHAGNGMALISIIFLAIGAFLAAAISGAAGFGGALLLLPLLTLSVGVTEAVPLLTIAQLVGNLSRMGFGYREIRWRPVALFLLAAIPFAGLGAASFVTLSASLIGKLLGFALLIFVFVRQSGILKLPSGNGVLLVGGAVTGGISGLVGSAGPLGAALFLSLNLPPAAYVASEAVTAVAMHGVKAVVYDLRLDFSPSFWPLALVLGGAMILGSWAGKRLIDRMPIQRFQRFVSGLLAVTAVWLIVTS